jgi:hypothetical protein
MAYLRKITKATREKSKKYVNKTNQFVTKLMCKSKNCPCA